MLLDPFEKQFDLPSIFIKKGDFSGLDFKKLLVKNIGFFLFLSIFDPVATLPDTLARIKVVIRCLIASEPACYQPLSSKSLPARLIFLV